MKTSAYRIRHDYDLLSGLTHGNQLVGIERNTKVDPNGVECTAVTADDTDDGTDRAGWNCLVDAGGEYRGKV